MDLIAQECLTESKGFLEGLIRLGFDGQSTFILCAEEYGPGDSALS